jgi:hypothetical protein
MMGRREFGQLMGALLDDVVSYAKAEVFRSSFAYK